MKLQVCMKILIIKLCRKVVCYLFICEKFSCMLPMFHMLFRWSASSKKRIWVLTYYIFNLVVWLSTVNWLVLWRKNYCPHFCTSVFHHVSRCLTLSPWKVKVSCSVVTPWTAAHQAPLSMEFSRQEYWSRLPFPFPGDLPNPGMEPRSPASQADYHQSHEGNPSSGCF